MLGRTISHYRISSQLGAGGMGIVYAAEDVRLGRPVALKVVLEEFAKDPTVVERLRLEARAASALNHPNICTIYDVGESEDRPFIVMELLKGQTLRSKLESGPVRVSELVDIGIQVADALDAAHRNGILHRDIKPANLFLVDRGIVKILDFGLAKRLLRQPSSTTTVVGESQLMTTQGLVVGTVAYMSPEQVSGEPLDGRTDIFSLGIVLYECATGRLPFTGKTPGVILAAILNQSPVAPTMLNSQIPVRLQEVMNNCLEKDPELRYPDAAALRADLKRIRRDLESGQSRVLGTVSTTSRIDRMVSSGEQEQRRAADAGSRSQRRMRRWMLPALTVTVTAALISAWILNRKPITEQPALTIAARAPDVAAGNSIDLAAASLRAGNYREALQYADDALTRAPNDIEAARIRQQARAAIDRFEEALGGARRLLALGDFDGASAALVAASAIDPQSPAVAELSERISQQRTQGGRTTPRASPTGPTTASSSPSSRGAVTPAPPEEQRSVAQPAEPASTPSTGAAATSPPATAAPAQSPPTPQNPVAVNPQPAAPVVDVPPQPAQPPRSVEPARPRDDVAASRGRAAQGGVAEDDDLMIRRVIEAWVQAIERKDLAAYRAVKPNLSPAEVRRIEEGFRSVSSQRVAITILGINHEGQNAVVRLRRRDTIVAGGRQQTTDIQQTMTVARSGAGWIITEIGR
jgi:serine/threonine protein kinase